MNGLPNVRGLAALSLLMLLVGYQSSAQRCTEEEVQRLLPGLAGSSAAVGRAVALQGGRAVVAAPFETRGTGGTIQFFENTGGGWIEVAELFPPLSTGATQIGYSVDLDEDVVVAGSPFDTNDFGQNAGSAHTYRRAGGVWQPEQWLTASNGAAFDEFGRSVAIHGDAIVVGASLGDGLIPGSGTAYVYRHDGARWVHETLLFAADAQRFDTFGSSAGIHGDWIAVGARGDDNRQGSVYLFRRIGGIWSEFQKLQASDGDSGDEFGNKLDLHGNVLLVGAPNDEDAKFGAGSAYVFRFDGGLWQQEQKLLPYDPRGGAAHFGEAVALDDGIAVIGAPEWNTVSEDTGTAYVFQYANGQWIERFKLLPSERHSGGRFGLAVAVDSGLALIGCPYDDGACPGGGCRSGSSYLFDIDLQRARAIPCSGTGRNPLAYSSSAPPLLGTNWTATVNVAHHAGAIATAIAGFAAPLAPTVLMQGELLVDTTSPMLLLDARPAVGGSGLHDVAIPNLPSLVGVVVATQAATLGGGTRLCNAIDLLLGT